MKKYALILITIMFVFSISATLISSEPPNSPNKCDKIREECGKISKKCSDLEAKNAEIYDECQKIFKGYWDCFDIEEYKQRNKCFLKVLEKYNNCEDKREKLAPLIDDCWKSHNECFDRYQSCLNENN
ncbi:hypothetical protein HY643_01270 [Candidatus Woesearchaeota archaeon]|nr:hypothetical protein [Candidatus Woesearchaeota archaeon]